MNVYQKIAEVMKEVQYLCKDDAVEYKTTKYRAISEEKVTSTVRASLVKHGLVILPVEQKRERVGQITSIDAKYRIQNVDDTEDYVIVTSSGDGYDSQDKGAGKAMTYAYKYMLLRAFAIPTGEDPDKVSSAEIDGKECEKYVKVIKKVIFEICGKDKTSAEQYWRENVEQDKDDLGRLQWHYDVLRKQRERIQAAANGTDQV